MTTIVVTPPPVIVVATSGSAGPRGSSILSGAGVPAAGLGRDGDWYINNANPAALTIYGPKTGGAWGTSQPIGGSGGGTLPADRTAENRIKIETVTLPNTGGWGVITTSGGTPLACSIRAAAGDRILADATFMRTGTGDYLDLALLTSAGAISVYAGSGDGTPLQEGNPAYYPGVGNFPGATGTVQFTVQAGHIDGNGKITIALTYRGAGSGSEQIYASATYPFYLLLTNIGPQPD